MNWILARPTDRPLLESREEDEERAPGTSARLDFQESRGKLSFPRPFQSLI